MKRRKNKVNKVKLFSDREELTEEEIQLKSDIAFQIDKMSEGRFIIRSVSGGVRAYLIPIIQSLEFSDDKEQKRFLPFYTKILRCPHLPLFDTDQTKLICGLWRSNPDFNQSFLNYIKRLNGPILTVCFWDSLFKKLYSIPDKEIKLYLVVLTEVFPSALINENTIECLWKYINKSFRISFEPKWQSFSVDKAEAILYKNCGRFFRWAKLLNDELIAKPAGDRDFENYELLIEWFQFIRETKYKNVKEYETFLYIMEECISIELLLNVGRKKLNKIFTFFKVCPERFYAFKEADKKIEFVSLIEDAGIWLLDRLFGNFRVPFVFIKKFYNLNSEEMNWFKHVAKGNNISTAQRLPFKMTKKAAHVLMSVHIHLTNYHRSNNCFSLEDEDYRISDALLFAQILSMKANPDMAAEIIRSRISDDLRNFEFWQTVIDFFIKNKVLSIHICPLVDYIRYRKAHETSTIFSIKGRTFPALLRNMEMWHHEMNNAIFYKNYSYLKWDPVPINNYECQFLSEKYQIIQLVSNEELYMEGRTLHHCVFSYFDKCISGVSSIWSLRKQTKLGIDERLLTIEMRNGKIVQARGLFNREPTRNEAILLKQWAKNKKIYLDIPLSA